MDQAQTLQGRRILVVEDDYMMALILAEILEAAGAVVLGPVGWLDEALEFIGRDGHAIDGAVLDVNLHGQPSYPVADALIAQGIRFVFSTGYGSNALDEAYRMYPRCEKPFRSQAILAALAPSSS
jgi:CheY-like chemotaxis protein